jgi:CBS domain-containing protein
MMAAHRIHSVVVWSEAQEADEEGTLWGVVSDLDLARAIATGELGSTARAVTSTPVVTVVSTRASAAPRSSWSAMPSRTWSSSDADGRSG